MSPTKKFWDEESAPVSLLKSSKGDQIQIKRVRKAESTFIDVRTWWLDAESNLNPGKGIAVPIELADEVAEAIKLLSQEM